MNEDRVNALNQNRQTLEQERGIIIIIINVTPTDQGAVY